MPWQPNPVQFPDIELVVTGGLRGVLPVDVFVGRAIPSEGSGGRRPRMVIVNRDGGNDDGVTDFPRVRLRVWDQSAQAANDLAGLVAASMQRLVGTTAITRARKESGPYDVPDESGQEQRYLLFSLRTEGVQLP